MSKANVDLSGFKKIHEDNHSATLRHHKGHEFKIAKSKLSPKLKSQLDKLPMHGKEEYAEGGEVQNYAEDTDSTGIETKPGDDLLADKAKYYQQIDPNLSYGNAIAKAAVEIQGTKDRAAYEADAPKRQQQEYEQSIGSLPKTRQEADMQEARAGQPPLQGVKVASIDPTSGLEELPARTPAATPTGGETLLGPAKTPTAATSLAPSPSGALTAAQQTQLGGLQKIGAGQAAEAAALGQQGRQQVAVEKAYQLQQQNAMNEFTKANEPLVKARQELMNDIAAGQINPRHYVDEVMGTGGKIRTAIGLIIGGMGSGLTGGPNLAAKYLENQIENDISAQKANLGKKESLLSHNLAQTKSLSDAYNMTRMQSNDILSSHLREVAGTIAEPMAKAKLMEQAGLLDQQTGQLQQQFAINRLVNGPAGQQSEGDFANRLSAVEQINPAAAKDMREKFVPGVGYASIPVPEKSRQAFITFGSAEKALQEAMNFQKEHGGIGTFSGSAASAAGDSLRTTLVMHLKNLHTLGALSGADLDLMDKLVPTLGSMFDSRTKAKLNELSTFLQDKFDTEKQAYRITPFSDTVTQGQQPARQIRFTKAQ